MLPITEITMYNTFPMINICSTDFHTNNCFHCNGVKGYNLGLASCSTVREILGHVYSVVSYERLTRAMTMVLRICETCLPTRSSIT